MGDEHNERARIQLKFNSLSEGIGGEGGIRTHGRRKPTTVFETATIDHSVTSPRLEVVYVAGWIAGRGLLRKGQSAEIRGCRRAGDHGQLRRLRLGNAGGRGYLCKVTLSCKGSDMILRRFLLVAALAFAPPSFAETSAEPPVAAVSIAELGKVLQLDALFQVLREEGLAHGDTLQADMFPMGGGAAWKATVAGFYDLPLIRARFNQVLRAKLAQDPATLQAIIAFYDSELGQRVVGLEIEARRAFLDIAAEEAARVAAEDAASAKDPKVALIRRMIEAGDLLEMNVAGSMTGTLAFMSGMADSGAYGANIPEEQVISDAWGQEDATRADLSTWLYAFLGLAYAPLTEAELQSYVEFWESPAGQRLNTALFAAFDEAFRTVSYDLGHAAGTAMLGRDI
jgi:Uncharacterized protein conserved in bacteria (DUF2059)